MTKYIKKPAPNFNTVITHGFRQCNRPERIPGVAPACEDDLLPSNADPLWHGATDIAKRNRVRLPEVKWLKRPMPEVRRRM